MRAIRTLTHLAASLAVTASYASAVHAADDAGVPTQLVRVADLNLSSPHDVAELFSRINAPCGSMRPTHR
jgi:UrcA family protein